LLIPVLTFFFFSNMLISSFEIYPYVRKGRIEGVFHYSVNHYSVNHYSVNIDLGLIVNKFLKLHYIYTIGEY
jgi:hypothetical protein